MGGCQNYGPFLGTLHIRCGIIIGIPKGTIILTTAHVGIIKRLRWHHSVFQGHQRPELEFVFAS